MSKLGIIGSGNIGAAIARLAVAGGVPVVIANSRRPESLADLVDELGPLAVAGTIDQAAAAGEVVVLSVPLPAHTSIPPALFAGKVVLDTGNYYPYRDGRIRELDDEQVTTSELVQRHFADAHLVKAFNSVLAHHIPLLARPSGAADRTALPVAGDDQRAKSVAAAMIDRLGYDVHDVGSLAESWRFEPEAAGYTRVYLADQSTPVEDMLTAPAAPVDAARLAAVLESAERVRVADRTF